MDKSTLDRLGPQIRELSREYYLTLQTACLSVGVEAASVVFDAPRALCEELIGLKPNEVIKLADNVGNLPRIPKTTATALFAQIRQIKDGKCQSAMEIDQIAVRLAVTD